MCVKSHTTQHQGQFFFCDVVWCSVKSHTTLHQGQFFCDVLLCSVKSHTTLHQGQVSVAHHPSSMSTLTILFVRNSEVLLPNFLQLPIQYQIVKTTCQFVVCCVSRLWGLHRGSKHSGLQNLSSHQHLLQGVLKTLQPKANSFGKPGLFSDRR